MKVYRYEHWRTKMGPYSQPWSDDGNLHDAHNGDLRNSHPTPRDSFGWDVPDGYDWICGCDTRTSLGRWFRGFKNGLLDAGFVVREYDVPDDNVLGPDEYGQVVFWGGKVVS